MTRLEAIKAYVEGGLSSLEFQSKLTADPELETWLSTIKPPKLSSDHASLFHYLLDLDLDNPFNEKDAKTVCADLVRQHGVECSPKHETTAGDEKLLLRLSPRWARVPPAMMKRFLHEAGGRTGRDREEYVRSRIKESFVFVKKPPAWLQDAEWPIVDGRPLVFVVQGDVSFAFHDTSAVYLFIDPQTRRYTTVVQST